jgi:hypothetical protein
MPKEIIIKLARRIDGGLCVCSDDVPGLSVEGPFADEVLRKVWPALVALKAEPKLEPSGD